MKIIYFILFFGIVLNISIPVYDIYYNLDYNLKSNYVSGQTYYLFRTPMNGGEKMDFVFTLPKKSNIYFHLKVCQFTDFPSDDYINNELDLNSCDNFPTYTDSYEDNNYIYYYFTYGETYYTTKFLVIDIYYENYQAYSYLYFKIDVATYSYSNIKELEYNQNYELNTKIFNHYRSEGVIPKNYKIYIRIKVNSNDEMEIRLTTKDTSRVNGRFSVDVCQFKNYPKDSEVYYPTQADIWTTVKYIDSTDRNLYKYSFTTGDDIKYLTIRIVNNYELNYLNIYIYSEIGMAAAIIAVIVIIPILVVGGIVAFLLRKFGCIGRPPTSI